MENKNKSNKNVKHDKNKTIQDTYNEIIDYVLQDNSEEKTLTKVINLDDFRNKKIEI